uniref:Uncharacterized protein n=1 Tax=viral metagenome TaxID=1070528 RepID=A0A6C0IIG5_9ZZZZ
MNYNRSRNKWTVNEILSLEREYELLEMTIQEIALKHSRSVEAILFRLDSEGFINNWYDARGYNNFLNNNNEEDKYSDASISDTDDDSDDDEDSDSDDDDDSDSNDDDEIVNLNRRVGYVEITVNEIKNMVTNFLNSMSNSSYINSNFGV